MNPLLNKINTEVYSKCELKISDFTLEAESQDYAACRFTLNGQEVILPKIRANENFIKLVTRCLVNFCPQIIKEKQCQE